jgi:hypothetical protein
MRENTPDSQISRRADSKGYTGQDGVPGTLRYTGRKDPAKGTEAEWNPYLIPGRKLKTLQYLDSPIPSKCLTVQLYSLPN